MRRAMTLGLPPFTTAVKRLVFANIGVFVGLLLLKQISMQAWVLLWQVLPLSPVPSLHYPYAVMHGAVWQIFTYAFLHLGFMHVLFNMLALWMFGSQLEVDWGVRKFTEFFFWCVAGAAVTTIALGYLGLFLNGLHPLPLFGLLQGLLQTATAGASGGVFGILIAFGMFYGDREIFVFPLPILIKARYFVAIWILIALVGVLGESGGVANFAHLGGALFGWIYLRLLPRRGLGLATSEGYYGLRNRYYRWKRKRAQRKFEVYMRGQRREDHFDEYGNHKDPRRGGDGRGRLPRALGELRRAQAPSGPSSVEKSDSSLS